MRIRNDFRIRSNNKLYEQLNNMNVVQRINIQQLRWLGHVRVENDTGNGRGDL